MNVRPRLEVVIEVPRGGFAKVGSSGRVDFLSPLPCPYNYGYVDAYFGLEGDLLDAVVLGPRLARGTRVTVDAWGAIGLTDRDLYDDKMVCATRAPTPAERRRVVRFFHFYAWCKGWWNRLRGRAGRTCCEGWSDAASAMARARPRRRAQRPAPRVPF